MGGGRRRLGGGGGGGGEEEAAPLGRPRPDVEEEEEEEEDDDEEDEDEEEEEEEGAASLSCSRSRAQSAAVRPVGRNWQRGVGGEGATPDPNGATKQSGLPSPYPSPHLPVVRHGRLEALLRLSLLHPLAHRRVVLPQRRRRAVQRKATRGDGGSDEEGRPQQELGQRPRA